MMRVVNANVMTPDRIIRNGSISVENGKITAVESGNENHSSGDSCIDASGCYLAPGFIDIHTHGAGGHDFMDCTVESFHGAAELHARHGTTTLLPTMVACSHEKLISAISAFQKARALPYRGASMPGLHLEGPYLAASQKGALDAESLKTPDPDEYNAILEFAGSRGIFSWTAAPELSGALKFARILRDKGILVCAGHSDAIFEEAEEGYENGFRHATHLYSAMSTVHRINGWRIAGLLEYALYQDGMTVEIIADGCHLPASLLKLIYKIKGPDRIALVTDSMRAAGMPEGEYLLGRDTKVIVEDDVAKLPDRSAFAGSVATADRLVRTMVCNADVPLTDAVRMITATPARIIGLELRKGTIAQGMDADFVLFDENINVKMTVVDGRVVYSW